MFPNFLQTDYLRDMISPASANWIAQANGEWLQATL
jgi:hypothetical protein